MSFWQNVAILGGTGYGAGELLRLLVQHPSAKVAAVISSSQVGAPVERVHPHLRGFYPGLMLEAAVDYDRLLEAEQAVVFSALPHEVSGMAVDAALNELAKRDAVDRSVVIDLSGALRLKDFRMHAKFYPECPELRSRRTSFVYGLPELGRAAIGRANCIANPGCLATAATLAAAPLVRVGGASGLLAVDAKTGSSGSGRQLKEGTHHPTRHANYVAYKPLAHQHEPEILQALGDPRGDRLTLSFVPQSLDTTRGIFVTVHGLLAAESDSATMRERIATFYADSPFIRVVEGSPELQNVIASNFCDIGVAVRGRQAIVMAAIDNLVKGMAGAAIQNMNLCCGLPETAGLWTPAPRPV